MLVQVEGSPLRLPAWEKPTWVLGVMLLPNDPVQLAHIAAGGELPFTRGSDSHLDWLEGCGRASMRGHVSGFVLAMLYALDRAGWALPPEPKPSLSVAFRIAAAAGADMNRDLETPEGRERVRQAATLKLVQTFGRELPPLTNALTGAATGTKFPRFPKRTTVETFWHQMRSGRSVAHLWGAYAMHRLGLMGRRTYYPLRDLFATDQGMRVLLATAVGVQAFARAWRTPDTEEQPSLLGSDPWLVRGELPLMPVWPDAPPYWVNPAWLSDDLADYGTRGAKGRDANRPGKRKPRIKPYTPPGG
jgi:hypothetical protein